MSDDLGEQQPVNRIPGDWIMLPVVILAVESVQFKQIMLPMLRDAKIALVHGYFLEDMSGILAVPVFFLGLGMLIVWAIRDTRKFVRCFRTLTDSSQRRELHRLYTKAVGTVSVLAWAVACVIAVIVVPVR